jgi:hypothetical protein
VRSPRKPPIGRDGLAVSDGKFSVPRPQGRDFFGRLNQSFNLFVKTSSTVPA